jgi:hypothetical protein
MGHIGWHNGFSWNLIFEYFSENCRENSSFTKLLLLLFNCNLVDTRWQQYSTHLHTNSTQNTEDGAHITIKKKLWSKLGRAGRAPSVGVIPWHLPYNWGKSTEKPQSSRKVPRYPGGSSPVHIYTQTIHRTDCTQGHLGGTWWCI